MKVHAATEQQRPSYDIYNLQYQQTSMDQWGHMRSDETPYSHFWSSPQAFEPKQFSENVKKDNTYRDYGWNVAFWINLAVVVVLFVVLIIGANKKQSADNTSSVVTLSTSSNTTSTSKLLGWGVGGGILVGLITNIIHMVYLTYATAFYVKFGFFLGVGILFIFCLIPAFMGAPSLLYIPIFLFLVALVLFFCCRKYFPLTIAIMKMSVRILWDNPSLIVVELIQTGITLVSSIFFAISFVLIVINEWSYLVYLYYVFSYFWVTITFGYVIYMTSAGVASTWYFLTNSAYYPESPVWASFKRAFTTSFGSASVAGFLLAAVKTLQYIVEQARKETKNLLCAVLACIALCLLAILKTFVEFMNRYALIYCATFGVPFFEGCRRWLELSCKKFVGLIANSLLVDGMINYHIIVFSVLSVVLGVLLGMIIDSGNALLIAVVAILSLVFCIAIISVLQMPITTMCDALYVCFAENPERLKSSAYELYESLAESYSNNLREMVESQKDVTGVKIK